MFLWAILSHNVNCGVEYSEAQRSKTFHTAVTEITVYSPSSVDVHNMYSCNHSTIMLVLQFQIVSTERVLKLMDFEEGSFQDYTGQYDGVNVVVFSPSGGSLISTCGPTLHLWNIILE